MAEEVAAARRSTAAQEVAAARRSTAAQEGAAATVAVRGLIAAQVRATALRQGAYFVPVGSVGRCALFFAVAG